MRHHTLIVVLSMLVELRSTAFADGTPIASSSCDAVAGRYAWGNGFESGLIALRPDCEVELSAGSDSGDGWTARSVVSATRDKLTLESTPVLMTHEFPLELRVVHWAERRYLIPEFRLVAFCNAVNAGREPSRERGFFVTPPNATARPPGLPAVPPEVAAYLLPRPITGRILSVVRDEIVSTIQVGDCVEKRRVQTALVRVSIRRQDGALPGMTLYGSNPRRPNFEAEMQLTMVEDDNSIAEVLFHVARVRSADLISTQLPSPPHHK